MSPLAFEAIVSNFCCPAISCIKMAVSTLPKVHILGGGVVGNFIAHALTKARTAQVVLMFQTVQERNDFKNAGRSIAVLRGRDGAEVPDIESGFLEDFAAAASAYSPDQIENLVVTMGPHQIQGALDGLEWRIGPKTEFLFTNHSIAARSIITKFRRGYETSSKGPKINDKKMFSASLMHNSSLISSPTNQFIMRDLSMSVEDAKRLIGEGQEPMYSHRLAVSWHRTDFKNREKLFPINEVKSPILRALQAAPELNVEPWTYRSFHEAGLEQLAADAVVALLVRTFGCTFPNEEFWKGGERQWKWLQGRLISELTFLSQRLAYKYLVTPDPPARFTEAALAQLVKKELERLRYGPSWVPAPAPKSEKTSSSQSSDSNRTNTSSVSDLKDSKDAKLNDQTEKPLVQMLNLEKSFVEEKKDDDINAEDYFSDLLQHYSPNVFPPLKWLEKCSIIHNFSKKRSRKFWGSGGEQIEMWKWWTGIHHLVEFYRQVSPNRKGPTAALEDCASISDSMDRGQAGIKKVRAWLSAQPYPWRLKDAINIRAGGQVPHRKAMLNSRKWSSHQLGQNTMTIEESLTRRYNLPQGPEQMDLVIGKGLHRLGIYDQDMIERYRAEYRDAHFHEWISAMKVIRWQLHERKIEETKKHRSGSNKEQERPIENRPLKMVMRKSRQSVAPLNITASNSSKNGKEKDPSAPLVRRINAEMGGGIYGPWVTK